MCLFNILQTIQKLKAAVAVLVDDHNDKLTDIKTLYFKKATVKLDSDTEEIESSQFMKFLEIDGV